MPQNIQAAVRPVLYQTDWEEWPYSHGGSLFVIEFKGKCFGLTCKHVIGNGGANHLFVAPRAVPQKGMRSAEIERVAFPNNQDNDLRDIAVICFSDSIGPEFFGGSAYVVNSHTAGSSDIAHRLKVYGFLSGKTDIDVENESITGGYCDLQFTNLGQTSADPFLRQAIATYVNNDISSFDGISGAPVYDTSIDRLCGMVVRAGLKDLREARLWYIDIIPIVRLVEAVNAGHPVSRKRAD